MNCLAQANSAGLCTAPIGDCNPNFEHIISLDALHQGYIDASRGKHDRAPIMDFEKNLGSNLVRLHQSLTNGSYQPKSPRIFEVKEHKKRTISAPHIDDSVVQHAIYRAIYDLFDKSFIFDSYGCRKEKGAHRASDRVQRFMRQCHGDSYYLQLDIKGFYHNITHASLRERIERKISDKRLVDLMMKFVRQDGNVGLYIGNLLSQMYGLIILDRLDHHLKRAYQIKKYVRYVDDFVLLDLTLEEAQWLKQNIELWLYEHLGLTLSKWRIAKVKHGINFVGFRTWRKTRFVRKRSMSNFNKALKKECIDCLQSIIGNALNTGSYNYFIDRIRSEKPHLLTQLKIRGEA